MQHSVLKKWEGKEENVEEARKVLLSLALNNSLASKGQFVGGDDTNAESL